MMLLFFAEAKADPYALGAPNLSTEYSCVEMWSYTVQPNDCMAMAKAFLSGVTVRPKNPTIIVRIPSASSAMCVCVCLVCLGRVHSVYSDCRFRAFACIYVCKSGPA
jgi:hypothetical protein